MVFATLGLGQFDLLSARVETVRRLVLHPTLVQHLELVISDDAVLLEGEETRSYRDIVVVRSRGYSALRTMISRRPDASRLSNVLSFLRHAVAKFRELLP